MHHCPWYFLHSHSINDLPVEILISLPLVAARQTKQFGGPPSCKCQCRAWWRITLDLLPRQLAVFQVGRLLLSHTLGQPVKTNLTEILFMRKVVFRTFTHIHNETGMVTRNRKNEKVVIIWAHRPAWSSAPRISETAILKRYTDKVFDPFLTRFVECSWVVCALLKVLRVLHASMETYKCNGAVQSIAS